jgi:hypothetical protein
MRLALLLTQLLPVLALPSLNRAACQHPTRNPLSGCPAGTLLVGPNAPFRTIQSAVLSLANTTTASHILVLPGNYTEQVNITLPAPLYLLGQTASPRSRHANAVNVIWRNATGAGIVPNIDNAYTSTLTVAPTLNASLTGTGPTGFAVPADTPFGSADFRAYNLNFINDFADHAVGPALAVSVSYANAGFYFCGFYSYQDTVSFGLYNHQPPAIITIRLTNTERQIYIGKLANAYFHASEIAGQVDFLYGFGTAWIESSLLSLRGCGGGITAWKGTNTTTQNKYVRLTSLPLFFYLSPLLSVAKQNTPANPTLGRLHPELAHRARQHLAGTQPHVPPRPPLERAPPLRRRPHVPLVRYSPRGLHRVGTERAAHRREHDDGRV